MEYLRLIRVKHYLKNLLIFLPAIFSGMLFYSNIIFKLIIMFFASSFISSIVYIINDIKDIENDKKHPIKKNRPLASGKISMYNAFFVIMLLALSTIFLLYVSDLLFDVSTLILVFYFVLNLSYSFGLKNIPLVDIVILAFGFVLRVIYGGVGVGIEVSNWLFLTVLSISFYMAFGKRRNELLKNGYSSRKVLKEYNKNFLDKNMYMFLALTIVFYSLWVINTFGNSLFKYSIVFVTIILLKYCMDIEEDNFGDPIEVITHDKILLLLGFIYMFFTIFFVYCN